MKKETMTKTDKAWRKKYSEGDRSRKAKDAHAKYIRINGSSKRYMTKQYKDPDSLVKPKISLKSAVDRAKKMGCWVDDSPDDVQKQLKIYLECHKMNIRDGKNTWSVDHIVPLCFKGPHSSSNLQIMKKVDNTKKGLIEKKIKKSIRPLTLAGEMTTR